MKRFTIIVMLLSSLGLVASVQYAAAVQSTSRQAQIAVPGFSPLPTGAVTTGGIPADAPPPIAVSPPPSGRPFDQANPKAEETGEDPVAPVEPEPVKPIQPGPEHPAPVPPPGIGVAGTLGADVSEYQGVIDWTALAADKKFVFIRASHGAAEDDKFQDNWKAAKAAGVTRGAYHFFNPTHSINDQIRIFIAAVGPLEKGDLPPVLDLESEKLWKRVAPSRRVPMLMKWVKAVETAYGVKPILYLSPKFVEGTLGDKYAEVLKDYPLWIAHYEVTEPLITYPWGSYLIWQYSSVGACGGVKGYCDQNIFPGTLAQLQKYSLTADVVAGPVQHVDEEKLAPLRVCKKVWKKKRGKRFKVTVCSGGGHGKHGVKPGKRGKGKHGVAPSKHHGGKHVTKPGRRGNRHR